MTHLNIKTFADYSFEQLTKAINDFLSSIPAERVKDIKNTTTFDSANGDMLFMAMVIYTI